MILRLAIASLWARAVTVAMTILAIALSVALFLGVEQIRTGARETCRYCVRTSWSIPIRWRKPGRWAPTAS